MPASALARVVLLVTAGMAYALQSPVTQGVAVALPTIDDDLNAHAGGSQWIISGFLVWFAIGALTSGRIADTWGARRTFVGSALLFSASCFAVALCQTVVELVVVRGFQGFAAAGMATCTLTLVNSAYAGDEGRRIRAIATWTAIGAASQAFAPFIGGLLVTVSWAFLFYVTGVLALACALPIWFLRFDSDPRDRNQPSADVIEILALALSAGSALGFVIQVDGDQWRSPLAIIELALTVGFAALFVWRKRNPMLRHAVPVLVRIREVRVALTSGAGVNATVYSIPIVLAYAFQRGYGWSPLLSGLAMLPLFVPTIPARALAGRFMARNGLRPGLVIGFWVVLGSGVLLVFIGDGPYLAAAIVMIVLAVGGSFVVPAASAVAVGSAPDDLKATSVGLFHVSRDFGQALAAVVLGQFVVAYAPTEVGSLPATGVFIALIAAVCLLCVRWWPRSPVQGRMSA